MPSVAVAPASRASRVAAAAARWDAVIVSRPDLAAAVALQRELIGLMVALTDSLERGRLPRLSLPPRYVAAKLARGVPALAGEPIPLPVAVLKPALVRFCEALAKGGAGEAADHIRCAVETASLDSSALLAASVARDQGRVRAVAAQRGLAADLLWLVAELATGPFVHLLQQAPLTPAADRQTLADALAGWPHGYCPACGSWPALAEATAGQQVLRCSFCAFAFTVTGPRCVYCGEQDEAVVTFAPDQARQDRRVVACRGCSGYLKVVDVPALSPFPLLAITDLETIDLDQAAMARGYSRPALRQVFR